MPGTLITVAPTGSETQKADWPQLPTRLDEFVAEAQVCEAAGARCPRPRQGRRPPADARPGSPQGDRNAELAR